MAQPALRCHKSKTVCFCKLLVRSTIFVVVVVIVVVVVANLYFVYVPSLLGYPGTALLANEPFQCKLNRNTVIPKVCVCVCVCLFGFAHPILIFSPASPTRRLLSVWHSQSYSYSCKFGGHSHD